MYNFRYIITMLYFSFSGRLFCLRQSQHRKQSQVVAVSQKSYDKSTNKQVKSYHIF